MCGRFTVTAQPNELLLDLGVQQLPAEFTPRYNVAPQQDVLAVLARHGEVRAGPLRWGLVPYWAKDPAIGNTLINARAESLAEKPAFREALERRRCVVIADGFYEWAPERPAAEPLQLPLGDAPLPTAKRSSSPRSRRPVWIRLPAGEPFAIAALWERWQPAEGEPIYSCTLITTEANEQVRALHDRMPAILGVEEARAWLKPGPSSAVAGVLRPYPGELIPTRVSELVNSPRNDTPACIEPLGDDAAA